MTEKPKKKNVVKMAQELCNSYSTNKNINYIQGIKVLDLQTSNFRA